MTGEPDVAVPARAIGDRARGRMLTALLGDHAISAGGLARIAGLSASTTSEHLHILATAGIVVGENHGRHRYYRLANADVARAVEALQVIAPVPEVSSLREQRVSRELREARTCYDHLAGHLGLRLTDLLYRQGVIDGLAAGHVGRPPDPFPDTPVVRAFGIRPPSGRRPWLRGCLDWTGRRPHVAGQLGAQIFASFRDSKWLTVRPDSRAVRLTIAGEQCIQELEAR